MNRKIEFDTVQLWYLATTFQIVLILLIIYVILLIVYKVLIIIRARKKKYKSS